MRVSVKTLKALAGVGFSSFQVSVLMGLEQKAVEETAKREGIAFSGTFDGTGIAHRKWRDWEIEQLRWLAENGHTKEMACKVLNRPLNAIQVKSGRLGIRFHNFDDSPGTRGRNWREEDDEQLRQLWQDTKVSMAVMCKTTHRSLYALRRRALLLSLGPRPVDDSYLTVADICREMQVSHDRVSNWIRNGLTVLKCKSGKAKYLIPQESLLKFLEKHQDYFDASKVSLYLFPSEPQWLVDKRSRDFTFYPSRNSEEYSDEEDRQIISLFKLGKSDEEIGRAVTRSAEAIKNRRVLLGLSKGRYNDWELDILRQYSRYKTLDELQKMLPLRTVRGIAAKCEELKLPYHLSKERCEILDEDVLEARRS